MAQGDLFPVTQNGLSCDDLRVTGNGTNHHEKSVTGDRRPRGRPRKDAPQTAAQRARAYRKRKKKLIHFKSTSIEWVTPDDLFQALDGIFHFTLDVCADDANAKCPKYFTAEQDGLMQPWTGVCWMNPPYGQAIGLWVQKAFEASLYGATVVCLLPSRTDTRWWQRYILPLIPEYVTFLPGRQHFSGKDRAPFPNAVVIFWPKALLGLVGREETPDA